MIGAIEKRITLDLGRPGVQERIPVRQGDALVYRVSVRLAGTGAGRISADAAWAQVKAVLPDGKIVTADCTVGADGICTFTPGAGFFACGGAVVCRLILRGNDGAELCSPAFAFDVEHCFAAGVGAVSAEEYSRMAELLLQVLDTQRKCEDAADRCEDAAEACASDTVTLEDFPLTKISPGVRDNFLLHSTEDDEMARITWIQMVAAMKKALTRVDSADVAYAVTDTAGTGYVATLPELEDDDTLVVESRLRAAEAAAEERLGQTLYPFEESGDIVACEPFSGTFLGAIQQIAPVQDGTPSPDAPVDIAGYSAAVLSQTGKNLLPYPYAYQDKTLYGISFAVAADGSVTLNGTDTFSSDTAVQDFLLMSSASLPAGEYTLTGCPAGGGTYTYRVFAQITRANGSPAYLSDTGDGVSFTVEDGDAVAISIRIGGQIGTVTDLTFRPMLRLTGTADGYESPGTPAVYTRDFGETVYGGTFDWQTGVLTVTHGIIAVDGTNLQVVKNGSVANSYLYYASYPGFDGSAVLCTHFTDWVDRSYPENYTDPSLTFGAMTAGNTAIWFSGYGIVSGDNSTLTDATEFNTWLAEQAAAGTPVTVVGRLDSPYTVQLDPAVIPVLDGVNTLYGDTGSVVVTGKTDPVALIGGLMDRIAALETALVG